MQFLLIILIAYLTHYLLQYILQGYDSTRAAIFIYDDSDMHLVSLKFLQQSIDLLRLWHEMRVPYKALPTEVVGLADVLQQVFDVEYAADIIDIVQIYGYAAIAVFHDTTYHILE